MMITVSEKIKRAASEIAERDNRLIIFTDIGKDTDDSMALTYAVAKGIKIAEVVITASQPKESAAIARNLLDTLGAEDVAVTVGSNKAQNGQQFHDNIYKGSFSDSDTKFEEFSPDKEGSALVAIIGPATDAARLKGDIKKSYIMAQVTDDGEPDEKAYNFKCDMDAAKEYLNKKSSIHLVGKEQAYKVPLKKADFEKLARTGHPAGSFLLDHAMQSFEHFKNSLPEVFERAYKGTDNISYCYDPLTIAAIAIPSLLKYAKRGHVNMAVKIDGQKAKDEIFNTIFDFLKKQKS